ncbi:MAG: microcin ABC transporter permease, partial [Gammaproteobacteria bacterium]
MLAYILRRLLLIVPTLFGIMLVNFVVIQFAPGGPVEQVLARIQGTAVEATARVTSGSEAEVGGDKRRGPGGTESQYRGARGLDPEYIAQLEKQFGFDRPAHERFFRMLGNYITFDFGKSYFRDK